MAEENDVEIVVRREKFGAFQRSLDPFADHLPTVEDAGDLTLGQLVELLTKVLGYCLNDDAIAAFNRGLALASIQGHTGWFGVEAPH